MPLYREMLSINDDFELSTIGAAAVQNQTVAAHGRYAWRQKMVRVTGLEPALTGN